MNNRCKGTLFRTNNQTFSTLFRRNASICYIKRDRTFRPIPLGIYWITIFSYTCFLTLLNELLAVLDADTLSVSANLLTSEVETLNLLGVSLDA